MDGMGNAPQAKPTIAECQRAVCARKGLTLAEMKSPSRKRDWTLPRQVAMALARELTGKSWTQLGLAFGRDHTTVIYAARKINRLLPVNPRLEIAMERYREAVAVEVAKRTYEPIPVPAAAGDPGQSLHWSSRNKRPRFSHRGEWVSL